MGAMDAPEGLDREVFSGSGIADDAQDPAVDGTLMLAEESFECIEIAKPKAVRYVLRTFRHLASLSEQVYAGVGRKVTTAGVKVQVSGVRGQGSASSL
jgi:hypothetical protein